MLVQSFFSRRAAFVLVATLVACGTFPSKQPPIKNDGGTVARDGGIDGGTVEDDGGLPATAACEVLNAARCSLLTRCGLLASDAASQKQCLDFYAATWCGPTRWTSRIDPRINTLRYDGVVAQQCVDALDDRTCPLADTLPEACTRFLRPNALNRQDCYGGGYTECVEGTCRGAVCPRTCKPRGSMNESCDVDDDCRTGLYCHLSYTSPPVNQCDQPATLGDDCSTARCATGLFCNSRNFCVLLPAAPTACVQGQCDSTAHCSDAGVCVERKADGASCIDDVDCSLDSICIGSGLGATCAARQLTVAGSSCLLRQACPVGSVCLGATSIGPGTCTAALTEGKSCSDSTDCEAELTCAPGDGGLVCTRRLADGSSCRFNTDCQRFSNCVGGLCASLPTTGKTCLTSVGCLVGACQGLGDAGTLGIGVCVDPLGSGAPCRTGQDCASGKCEIGLCTASCQP